MKIQMLHTVLHDGKRIPADEIVTGLSEAAAQALVASGAAKAVEEPEAASDVPATETGKGKVAK